MAQPTVSPLRGAAVAAPTPGRMASRPKPAQGDRFIPNRSSSNLDAATFLEAGAENAAAAAAARDGPPSPSKEYQRHLASGLGAGASARVLAFRQKAPPPPEGHAPGGAGVYSANAGARPPRRAPRAVPAQPDRILDAPDLLDDYYLNLLDWGAQNTVAVALNQAVYLWSASTGDITQLCAAGGDEYVSSLSWAADGRHLAVGLSGATTQIWDAERARPVRALGGHAARVASLSWAGHTLSTGGRDGLVVNHDVRAREHVTGVLRGHAGEVCGLKWSPSGAQLASGGNDNALLVWDAAAAGGAAPRPAHRLTAHQAAVKALAWCPFQANLLASGGGTADRHIRFWNSHTGAQLNSVDTGSQVCALQWSPHERELLSSHGFSQNQLCLWKYPSLAKVAELTGHTSRVLHLATSPDGATVASAAADETLRFWRVFGEPAGAAAAKGGAGSAMSASLMRAASVR